MTLIQKRVVIVAVISMFSGLSTLISSGHIFVQRLTLPSKNVTNTAEITLTTPYPIPILNSTNERNNETSTEADVFLTTENTIESNMSDNSTKLHSNNSSHIAKIAFLSSVKQKWANYRQNWKNSKTFVLASSATVFVASALQFLGALVMIIMAAKTLGLQVFHRWTLYWTIVNTVICLVFIAVVICNGVFSGDPESSSRSRDKSKDESLFAFLTIHIYNVILAINAVIVFIIIIISSCILRHSKGTSQPQSRRNSPSTSNPSHRVN